MKIVVQNVSKAKLSINQKVVSKIQRGYVLLIGFSSAEDEKNLLLMKNKVLEMRILPDENGKTNLSLLDVKGEILAVPQFTLYANLKKGRRPSFIDALEPKKASELFNKFCALLKSDLPHLQTGVFGKHMEVALVNDGPFTIILDSKELFS